MAAITQMARDCQARDVSAVIFPEGTRSRDGSLGAYRVGGVASLMDGAPDLEIVPTVIDGSWRVFSNNMFPVPFGVHVRVAFGEPIQRAGDEDPEVILEQCREWAAQTLARWNESGESAA